MVLAWVSSTICYVNDKSTHLSLVPDFEEKLSAFRQLLSELLGFKNSLYQVYKYSPTSSMLSIFIKKKCWL